MRLPFLAIFSLLLVNLLVDLYLYVIARKRCVTQRPARLQVYSSIVLYVVLGTIVVMPYRTGANSVVVVNMWLLFSYLSIYAVKYIFVIFDLIASAACLFKARRIKWLSYLGFVLGIFVFLAMWWGALINRYRIDVNKVDVTINELPVGLNGLRIVQISDLHLGTFGTNTQFVSALVDSINNCQPDIVVFTGDIVNRKASELEPFADVLSGIVSRYGVYSILGNHDYGDYVTWSNPEDKAHNLAQLCCLQKDMGWRLLRNATDTMVINADTLMMIGVENIGDPPFHVYGDLSKAYKTPGDAYTKIMLSHNPAHWTKQIENQKEMNIALTLSGHTHAMQMTIGGWSPCIYRYKEWGGLFSDNKGRNLYVNIGDGTVGIPARIGAKPEITVITLHR